jgi:hypothetical protein
VATVRQTDYLSKWIECVNTSAFYEEECLGGLRPMRAKTQAHFCQFTNNLGLALLAALRVEFGRVSPCLLKSEASWSCFGSCG